MLRSTRKQQAFAWKTVIIGVAVFGAVFLILNWYNFSDNSRNERARRAGCTSNLRTIEGELRKEGLELNGATRRRVQSILDGLHLICPGDRDLNGRRDGTSYYIVETRHDHLVITEAISNHLASRELPPVHFDLDGREVRTNSSLP